jgi:hypothetical protein
MTKKMIAAMAVVERASITNLLRARERQRVSGPTRPAWPGNAIATVQT